MPMTRISLAALSNETAHPSTSESSIACAERMLGVAGQNRFANFVHHGRASQLFGRSRAWLLPRGLRQGAFEVTEPEEAGCPRGANDGRFSVTAVNAVTHGSQYLE
jgi:hypothetical protein